MKKRILIVDDCPNFLNAFQQIFEAYGFEAETARDGVEALEQIQQTSFDGITLGIIMPRMWGVEVLARIRQNHYDMPIIIISGGYGSLQEDEVEFLLANAQYLMCKPFDLQRFRDVVVRYFGPLDKT